MIKRRKPTYYQFQQVAAAAGQPPQTTVIEPLDAPSTLKTTVSVSGSIVLISGSFALLYGWEYQTVVALAVIPWAIYALGKGVYLVVLLVSDIVNLFDFEPSKKQSLLPIAREEEYEMP